MRSKIIQNVFFSLLALATVTLAGSCFSASAQGANRGSDRQAEQVLNRISVRAEAFRLTLDQSLGRNRINGTSQADEIRNAVASFKAATDGLLGRFSERRSERSSDVRSDVEALLSLADRINELERTVRLSPSASADWRALRSDLQILANSYNIGWRSSNAGSFGPERSNVGQERGNVGRERSNVSSAGRLNGTWGLDPARSDNVDLAIDRATSSVADSNRDRVRDSLRRRLEAPETLAIEQQGRSFTMASTRAPQVTFEADGQQRVEQVRNRSVRVEASLLRDQLTVSSVGDRGTDYRVTFDPIEGGRRLRVTRSIYSEQLAQPVVVSSFYDKSSDVAQLDLYRGGTSETGLDRNARGPSTVPNETELVAVLNNDLSTRRAQPGDRFTLTVRSPSQYDGAVIEGTILAPERSGRLAGRAQMSLDFERIRLRNGGSHPFAGYIESIRTPDGEDVRVDNEGVVRDTESQTGRTVTRGGIGAALGAIIGAIGGGGKGAAIGAAVGAGVGAGSVYVQGREDLELRSGTEVTIRASAPQAREALR